MRLQEVSVEEKGEQKEYLPVYQQTLQYAMEHGAADDYLDSRKLNIIGFTFPVLSHNNHITDRKGMPGKILRMIDIKFLIQRI